MQSFWITIRMVRSDILDCESVDDTLPVWLQEELRQATSLLGGSGKVSVERVDPLRLDVKLNFTVRGLSVTDVMDRFRTDFLALGSVTQGIDISETKDYKLWFPRIHDEQFPVFVRIDPDTGHPIYTED